MAAQPGHGSLEPVFGCLVGCTEPRVWLIRANRTPGAWPGLNGQISRSILARPGPASVRVFITAAPVVSSPFTCVPVRAPAVSSPHTSGGKHLLYLRPASTAALRQDAIRVFSSKDLGRSFSAAGAGDLRPLPSPSFSRRGEVGPAISSDSRWSSFAQLLRGRASHLELLTH